MIFLVEDEKPIRELLVYTLENTGFTARGFENGRELFEVLKSAKPELILLDIMLPFEDGISILKRIRENSVYSDIPIIMLSAKNTEFDKVMALDNGADDYIEKPFGMMELISRIKAMLRRSKSSEKKEKYTVAGVTLDVKSHTVTCKDSEVSLTLKEFELLELLMKNSGTVMTREVLLERIWGFEYSGETRTVDVHIRTLRVKLGDFADIIETVRGVGYRIGG